MKTRAPKALFFVGRLRNRGSERFSALPLLFPRDKIFSVRLKAFLHVLGCAILLSGCATIFGWDIHAPALVSQRFYEHVQPMPERLALYLDPSIPAWISKNKGGRFADPQTYHIGEAYVPIVIEGFQQGFGEFILMEEEPTQAMLRQYAIPHLVYVRPQAFNNDVSLKGQVLELQTETLVFDQELRLLDRFRTSGKSDSKKVFAKKGGPQVNLNAALENNAEGMILYIQDALRSGRWEGKRT